MNNDTTNLRVHITALDTIEACRQQAHSIESVWRTITPEYGLKAFTSLAQCLSHLFLVTRGLRDCEVYKGTDTGDLSLTVVSETGFVYGVVFHRTHRPDALVNGDFQSWLHAPLLGRYCLHSDGGDYCAKPIVNHQRTCEGHTLLPYVMPVPGEWSLHS